MRWRGLRYVLVLAVIFNIAFIASAATLTFIVDPVVLGFEPCSIEGGVHGKSEPENATK